MKKILVFGGSGLVGSRFIQLNNANFEIKSPTTQNVDILNRVQLEKEIESFNPDSVINFAAYTNVQEAENQYDNREGICYKVNSIGAKNIAEVCKDYEKHMIQISTEYVFDGKKDNAPYTEDDKPNPINWYGRTKFEGENYVLERGGKVTIVRISMPYSSYYEFKKDVARFFLERLKNKQQIKAVEDQWITPTLIDDIANALKVLIENQSFGIYHVCSKDSLTPLEFVKTIAETFKLDYSLITSIKFNEFNKDKKAKFIKYSWLNPTKFEKEFGDQILHTVEEGLVIFKQGVDSKPNN